jgi:hypothetical protein
MPASKAQRTKTAERRAKAVSMKIAGADWDTIAEALGYASKGAACTDVTRALEAATAEQQRNAEVLLYLELARLDRLQRAFWPAALKGDEGAARTVLGCIDRRVKLLKLEPPQRHEVITLGAIEAEIRDLEQQMDARGLSAEAIAAGLDMPTAADLAASVDAQLDLGTDVP